MSKKHAKLPVHLVEYHNDALRHIYRAIGSRHLPLEDITLLHFDAHPDMIVPDIEADVVFKKQDLYDSLSIENWIVPALYAGHVNTVEWLKADWAKQIKDGHYKFHVGRHRDTSKIRVTCSDDYFLSECLYAPECELLDKKKIDFTVQTCSKNYEPEKQEKQNFLRQECYILDVDLDFFSTRNPIKEMFSDEDYQSLKSVYEFKPPASRSDADINACLEERRQLLADLKNMLSAIQNGDEKKWKNNKAYEELRRVFNNVKCGEFGEDVDADLLHEFGCTCDDPELPHHVSSEAEVDDLLVAMETRLKVIGQPPTLVTISRSSIDEYCPPDQVEVIQDKVERSLKRLYSEIEIFHHYKED